VRGIAAAAVGVIVAGLAYLLLWPASPTPFALGENFETAPAQRDAGLVTGPVGLLAKACAADLGVAQPGQRPAATDKTAVAQWVQGCEAGYHQDHPGQLVLDGVMYGSGARPCTGSCATKAYADGQRIARSASVLPGLNPRGATGALGAARWCADLLGNRLGVPLSPGVESRLRAGQPAPGPATGYWDQGCEATYRAAPVPRFAGNGLTVSGAFGAAPGMTIPATPAGSPLYVKNLIEGGGPAMTATDGLVGDYVVYDWSGTTHKMISSTYSSGSPAVFAGQMLPGLEQALIGQRAGSRVLAVIPPADGFGSSGSPQEGIGAGDTLVFVVDMISTFGTSGVHGTQASDGGGSLPTVTPPAPGSTAGPAIAIPATAAPPATLQAKALIKGTGPVVRRGQDIAVQYTGVNWRTRRVFASSWSSGTPLTVAIGEGQVIKGWDAGLVGQTVGSRVLLVIPPADGYGSAGSASVGIAGADTLAFVVDILASS
jgi:peptidylprolyl isomerase